MKIKYWLIMVYLVTWKISTCGVIDSDIPKDMYEDEYGQCHGTRLVYEPEIVEKRKIFRSSDAVVKFIENAPDNATDFRISSWEDK